jgi:hypothetical protein
LLTLFHTFHDDKTSSNLYTGNSRRAKDPLSGISLQTISGPPGNLAVRLIRVVEAKKQGYDRAFMQLLRIQPGSYLG